MNSHFYSFLFLVLLPAACLGQRIIELQARDTLISRNFILKISITMHEFLQTKVVDDFGAGMNGGGQLSVEITNQELDQ